MSDEANFILHLQPSSLTPKSYSNSEMYHQSIHRQQYCPDPSAKKILPTCFHDHLHLELLLIYKPGNYLISLQEFDRFHQKNINNCTILSPFMSVFPAGKRDVGVANPPLSQSDIFFLLQECNKLPNREISSLPNLIKQSQLPPNSKLCFLRVFTRKYIRGCIKDNWVEHLPLAQCGMQQGLGIEVALTASFSFSLMQGICLPFSPLDHSCMQ